MTREGQRVGGSQGIDSAILKALSIDPESCTMQALGGSGFTETYKISANTDGKVKSYFLKTGPSGDMFRGGILVLRQHLKQRRNKCQANILH